jgi:hypothetical protein
MGRGGSGIVCVVVHGSIECFSQYVRRVIYKFKSFRVEYG